MIIACGYNRGEKQKVARVIGQGICRANTDFVKSSLGFAIRVAPIGHHVPPITILDPHLENVEVIWAAAGTPNAVFCLTPKQLESLTNCSFEDISEVVDSRPQHR